MDGLGYEISINSLPTSNYQVLEVFFAFIFTELWAVCYIYGVFKHGFVCFKLGLVWFTNYVVTKKHIECSETPCMKGILCKYLLEFQANM